MKGVGVFRTNYTQGCVFGRLSTKVSRENVKYWSNTGFSLVKYWSNSVKYWILVVQIMFKF